MILLELVQQVGLTARHVASTHGGEYASSCPNCGGKDRFRIWPSVDAKNCKGRYWCRQCTIEGDSIQFARDFLGLSFNEAVQAANATITQNNCYVFPQPKTPRAILQKPPIKWLEQAYSHVENAHSYLLKQSKILDSLALRGIPIDAVIKYKIGWLPQDRFYKRESWGLTAGNLLCLPAGIVIPSSELNGDIVRIKIRRDKWKEGAFYPKYIAVSGSMNGFMIVGNCMHKVMVVVESELDAYAIHFAAGDFVFVVAVGGNSKNPDNVTDRSAKQIKNLIICHDNDEAGKKMFNKWQQLYPHAKPYSTPIGKDIGEAIRAGLDIREWLRNCVK